MNYRKQILLILVLAGVILGVGWYFITSCSYNDSVCISNNDALGGPLVFFSTALLLSSIFLLFFSESSYKSWKKFATWAIPVGAVILYLAPASSPGTLGIGFGSFTKETASWLVSGVFLFISLVIIVKKRRG